MRNTQKRRKQYIIQEIITKESTKQGNKENKKEIKINMKEIKCRKMIIYGKERKNKSKNIRKRQRNEEGIKEINK